jgi:hypothetical protein
MPPQLNFQSGDVTETPLKIEQAIFGRVGLHAVARFQQGEIVGKLLSTLATVFGSQKAG